MRCCISSMLLLTICDASVFDNFSFESTSGEEEWSGVNSSWEDDTAYIRTRATPVPTPPPIIAAYIMIVNFQNKIDGYDFADTYTGTTKLYLYRRTAFDLLKFWSGESMKVRRDIKNYNTHKSKHARRKAGRAGSEEVPKSSKEIAHSTVAPEELEDTHKQKNLKLNGYTLKEVMDKLMSRLDANVTVRTIGTTIERHAIVLCQITRKPAKYFRALEGEDKYVVEEPQKKIILIVHGLSAMGFRKVPCLYQSDNFMELVNMYAEHLDKFDIYLVPMANPDGISDETLSIWNKNKSPQSSCPGVLLDRNFDVGWKKTENLNSCSQDYPGTRPFSEPESRAVADLIHLYNTKLVAYIHVHGGSYSPNVFKGDAVLYPKGYVNQPDDDKYGDMDAEIEDVLRIAGFKQFSVAVTSLHDWYGPVAGTSVDYATTVYGIPYGMEFVMQPYSDEERNENDSEEVSVTVLRHVWKKIIDAVFKNIYKATEGKEEESQ